MKTNFTTNKVSFFIQDRYYGSGEFTALFHFGSLAHFCAGCGKIWARELIAGSEKNWGIQCTPCENCGHNDPRLVPGSLIWHSVNEIPEYFPDSLAEREFFLHVAWLNRSQ